ncbi:type II toxin-antitoxin system prevent-host-death family antitoxin [Streptomyces sp. NPDC056002]|uniref:type II toxin-antitoxin system prevent-host-death family antitoxin n=1 Tax=Streptomyces sp. NPDC056002 TaxID=3345675 RepID=UPI0035D5D730
MTEEFSITRARPILGDLARRVATTREPLILTDHGRPIATLMPLSGQKEPENLIRDAAGHLIAEQD